MVAYVVLGIALLWTVERCWEAYLNWELEKAQIQRDAELKRIAAKELEWVSRLIREDNGDQDAASATKEEAAAR